ncbi:MAG: LamG domain-containing protein [Chloroflexaceae bacterium]|nr:LamG domain-containing protein [Chloroflexaceae bacterium]
MADSKRRYYNRNRRDHLPDGPRIFPVEPNSSRRVEIPIAIIPITAGKLAELERQEEWATDTDWQQGCQSALLLQEQLGVLYSIPLDDQILHLDYRRGCYQDSGEAVRANIGDALGRWRDQTRLDNHAMATGSARPVVAANGITFSVGKQLSCPMAGFQSSGTIAIRFTVGIPSGFLFISFATTRLYLQLNSANSITLGLGNSTPTFTLTNPLQTDITYAWILRYGNGTYQLRTSYQIFDGKYTGAASTSGLFYVGSYTDNRDFQGDIARLIAYNRWLSDTEEDMLRLELESEQYEGPIHW